MLELYDSGVYLKDGAVIPAASGADLPAPAEAREATIAYQIMRAHSMVPGWSPPGGLPMLAYIAAGKWGRHSC